MLVGDTKEPTALGILLEQLSTSQWPGKGLSISQEERRQIVDMIHDLFLEFDCKTTATFQLAIFYLDRYRTKKRILMPNIFAAACILISAKIYEVHAPTVSSLCCHSHVLCPPGLLLSVELDILDTLNWYMHDLLPIHFSEYFLSLLQPETIEFFDVLRSSTEDYMMMAAFDINMQTKHSPLTIALAALLMASDDDIFATPGSIESLIVQNLNPYLEKHNLKMSEIYEALARLHKIVQEAIREESELYSQDSLTERTPLISSPSTASLFDLDGFLDDSFSDDDFHDARQHLSPP